MGKIFKKWRKNNKGMTFVEILCAVAIMSLVSGIIGSVIVVSTRTYGKGISETNVQQEAQLAANNIGNIVKDAYKVVYKDCDDNKCYEDGEDTGEYNGDYTELTLVTGIDSEYSVFYYPSPENRLVYAEYELSTDSETGKKVPYETASGLLAENITEFRAKTDGFAKTRTITLYITVHDDSTDREIEMTYTMTSRNEAGTGIEYVEVEVPVQIYIDDSVILVPGETYQIPISVYGEALGDPYVDTENTSAELRATDIVTVDGEYYAEVTLGTDAADSYTLVVAVVKKSDGVTIKSAKCTVNVRRATTVSVSKSTNAAAATGGMYEEAGAKYTFSSTVSGTNLSKGVGYDYDTDYKNPQAVTWSWKLTLDGSTYLYGSTDNHVATDAYITVESYTEDASAPQITFEAQQAMTSNFKLIVTATSSHADGYNKADSDYADVSGYAELEPRDTKVSDAEIILEPCETGSVDIGMKGGLTSNVTCTRNGNTDSKTTAKYNTTTGKVDIELGKDETGVEGTYTFTVGVYLDGSSEASATITVHVSRIDEMSIEVIDNFVGKDGEMETPTYDFRGRINTDTAVYNDMVTATTYLVSDSLVYTDDNGEEQDPRNNTLATRITCEMINTATGKVLQTYQAVCIAGVGSDTSNNGSKIISETGTSEGKYFKVVDGGLKPARIEYSNGVPYIRQAPEIDVSPLANTDTGLELNYELKVTMEMLHPLGTVSGKEYNKTGEYYGIAEATASVKGEMTLEVPEDIIVVEPGQGTDVATMSDEEMVIPITVHGGGVYKMTVAFSDENVTLSSYDSTYADRYGNTNPYMSSTASSSSDRIWYMGIKVGAEAEGTDGLVDVTVKAYGTGTTPIASLTFQLAIRRVDKVTVKEDSGASVSEWNVAGKTVTLAAYPTGVDGVEYYAMQTDGTNARRWETSGHGAYQTPSTMVWRMYYNGEEKPLSKWTEYFTSISTSTVTDAKNDVYKGTVTFKLVSKLPSGARIRAYSLHSYGTKENISSDYKNDTDYTTKYNKSGKEYDGVYGELTMAIVLDSFQRGTDNFPTASVTYSDSWRSKYDGKNVEQHNLMRYKISGTSEWSNYHYTVEDSNAIKINASESRLFWPQYAYDVEYINVVINTSTKTLYWPHDESLLSEGGFEGYSKGWDDSEEATSESEYKNAWYIPEVTVTFTSPESYLANGGATVGTENSPVTLYSNNKGTPTSLSITISATGIALGNFQNYFNADWYKYSSGWESATMSNMQVSSPTYTLSNLSESLSGNWAFGVTLKSSQWGYYSSTEMTSTAITLQTVDKIELYSLTEPSAVAYFNFNPSSN